MSDSSQFSVTLRLEGRIIDGSVKTLESSAKQVLSRGRNLTLNLREVTFVDSAGVALLRSLREHRVKIVDYSAFVAQLLNEDRLPDRRDSCLNRRGTNE